MNKELHIAIVSTNQKKYSETFIHNHVRLLPGQIHFLYDGYLPSRYSTDRGLTGKSFETYGRTNWFNFRKKVSGNEQYNLSRSIELYLAKNKIDILFCEYGPSGVELKDIAARLNIPLLVHFHGYDAYRLDILETYGADYKSLFEQAAMVIVVSEHMKQQLLKLGCPAERLQLLPYGIDTGIFKPGSNAIKDNTFVSCGRFVAKKAPDLTIRAFEKVLSKLPEARLMMIGDGELLDSCKNQVNEKGLNHAVDFKGALSPAAVAEIFNRSRVFVHPSVTTSQNDAEGTPLTIMEAGACGLPVISTIHGGIPGVIMDNETGYLLAEGDVEGLADKMLHLATNPHLAQGMGEKASTLIMQQHNLNVYTERLFSLISRVVKENA